MGVEARDGTEPLNVIEAFGHMGWMPDPELYPIIEEQVPLYGRTKIDLLVSRVAVEIKALGSFGDDARKYTG